MRVMRILTRPNLGGPARQAVALWHEHQRLGVTTLLVTGAVDATETALLPTAGGVPRLTCADVLRAGDRTEGWVEVDALGRGFQPLRDWRTLRSLRALMAAFRPDVVHTHTSKAGLLGRRAAFAQQVPVVAHTFHGHVLRDYFPAPAGRLLAQLERHLARRCQLLFAVSPSCQRELVDLGIASEARIAVLRPAVPLPELLPRSVARAALGLPADGFVAACAGRLVRIKRVEDFVTAVAMVDGMRGDVHGSGPAGALLQQLATATAGRVRCCGPDPELASKLSAYDALVLPSRREGCPLVAIEAFHAGVPVIGYDVPGVRDVLATWGQGLLVAERDGPKGLAAALRRLRAEPLLTRDLAAAGRVAAAAFAPVRLAVALRDAYQGALADPNRGYAP